MSAHSADSLWFIAMPVPRYLYFVHPFLAAHFNQHDEHIKPFALDRIRTPQGKNFAFVWLEFDVASQGYRTNDTSISSIFSIRYVSGLSPTRNLFTSLFFDFQVGTGWPPPYTRNLNHEATSLDCCD